MKTALTLTLTMLMAGVSAQALTLKEIKELPTKYTYKCVTSRPGETVLEVKSNEAVVFGDLHIATGESRIAAVEFTSLNQQWLYVPTSLLDGGDRGRISVSDVMDSETFTCSRVK